MRSKEALKAHLVTFSSDNAGLCQYDVNAMANTRGSMNLTESMKLSDGFKFVWEFTPSQGNGTIAAVGLTSKHGGANAYGSEVAVRQEAVIAACLSSMTLLWLTILRLM